MAGFRNIITRPTGILSIDLFMRDVVETLKSFALAVFSVSTDGLVPGPTVEANKFLRDDGTWVAISGGTGGLPDGDYGDITISSSGAAMTVDNDAVTFAKMQNISDNMVLGRSGAGSSGDVTQVPIGTSASTDILSRADGDGRYDLLTSNYRSSIILAPGLYNGNQASTRNTGDNSINYVYMGKTPKTLTSASIVVFFRVTTAYTAGVGTSWAELVLSTGSVNSGGAPTLTPLVYADIASVINSTGIKAVTLSGITLAAGSDFWIGITNKLGAAGSASVIRGLSVGDDMVIGQVGTLASVRPSTNIGTPGTPTVDAFNTPPPWFAVVI